MKLIETLRNKSENLQLAMLSRWPLIKPTLINFAFLISLPLTASYLEGVIRHTTLMAIGAAFGIYSYNRGSEQTIAAVRETAENLYRK